MTSKAVRALHEEGRLERTGAGKKGDPYRYQRPSENTQKPSEILGFSRSGINEKPRNLESGEIAERAAIIEADGELSPEKTAWEASA